MKEFQRLPLMGIVRGISAGAAGPLIDCVAGAGLKTIEITMNTPDAPAVIASAREAAAGRIRIGAGTVLSADDLNAALEAGASFIVMPNLIPEIAASCSGKGVPVFPGALTPQEVFNAWQAGAAMVKVFPASLFGPRYIKELKGPFDKMKLMAVGGVRPENTAEYFACGADAVAFGGSVFKKDLIEKGDLGGIRSEVEKLVQEVEKAVSRIHERAGGFDER